MIVADRSADQLLNNLQAERLTGGAVSDYVPERLTGGAVSDYVPERLTGGAVSDYVPERLTGGAVSDYRADGYPISWAWGLGFCSCRDDEGRWAVAKNRRSPRRSRRRGRAAM